MRIDEKYNRISNCVFQNNELCLADNNRIPSCIIRELIQSNSGSLSVYERKLMSISKRNKYTKTTT